MAFYIVVFEDVEPTLINKVPTSWYCNERQAIQWPSKGTKNIRIMIEKSVPPAPSWPWFKARILDTAGKL